MILIIISSETGHRIAILTQVILTHNLTFYMSALYILIIVSIVVAATFLAAFIWSVRSDQFEDKQGSAMRMLYDDELKNKSL